MNAHLLILEYAIVGCGLALLLIDLWTPAGKKRNLGYVAAGAVALVLIGSFAWHPTMPQYAFGNSYLIDPLALYFKRLFLLAAVFVLLISVDYADRISLGISEFYALTLFALSGMLFAASANDFIMLFVSLELITVTFYILNSYRRYDVKSLEAGVKYLIMGALSTGFTLFGIALIYGVAHTINFQELLSRYQAIQSPLLLLGLFMVMVGLAFKISAFPFQIWAPDVYEGSPAPATAFLAIGSKAAGFVLLIRILFGAVPGIAENWTQLLIVVSAVTILYGNLCAIPQRNVKRLLGYSSIGNAGYLLIGVSAINQEGTSAVLYYLLGYLFAVLAAFLVISIVTRDTDGEDISTLAGLHHRSPLLAATLALSMISLAGIPPLAGFFGKFLLLKSVLEEASANPAYWFLIGTALFGIVVSFYYYFGVVRAIYWSREAPDLSPIPVPIPMRFAIYVLLAGIFFLGIFPSPVLNATNRAVAGLTITNDLPQVTASIQP